MANESNFVNELVENIHQFLSHQIETNSQLSDAAKESLTVAAECIETAYKIQRKPASSNLLDIYKSHKQQSSPNNNNNNNPAQAGNAFAANPAQFIQNLATSILSQATAGTTTSNANASASATTNTGSTTSSSSDNPTSSEQTSTNPPKERKKASEAEKLFAEGFKNQGNDFMKQDKYKEAFECYTRAIHIDDNNAIYFSNRAAASSKLGDHNAALRDCQEAVEIDATYSKAYGRMGLAYASLEDHKKAKEAYVKAVELDPTNESYRNNLKIAEEKLGEGANNAGAGGLPAGLAGVLGAAGLGGGQNNIMSMINSMMSNPEVMQMAMRSLQDPRMQSLFNLGGQSGGPPPDRP